MLALFLFLVHRILWIGNPGRTDILILWGDKLPVATISSVLAGLQLSVTF